MSGPWEEFQSDTALEESPPWEEFQEREPWLEFKPQGGLRRSVRSLAEAPIRIERGIGEKIGDVAAGGARAADILREGDLLSGPPTARKTILQSRRAFEQALGDPRYQAALTEAAGDPTRLAKVEALFGAAPRVEILRQPEQQRAAEAATTAIERQKRLEDASAVFQWGKEQADWSKKVFAGSPDIDDTFISELAVAFGGTLPDIGLAAVPGVGFGLASTSYGLQAGEQQASEAVAAGKPEAADVAFVAAAGLGVGSERLIGLAPRFWQVARMSRLANLPPEKFGQTLTSWLNKNPGKAKVIEGMLREGVQEGSEQAGQNIIASEIAGYDPDRPLLKNVPRATALGTTLGGLMGGGAHLAMPKTEAEEEARPWEEFQQKPEPAADLRPLTADLAAELQAAMTFKPKAETLKPAAVSDFTQRAIEELPAEARAEIEAKLTAQAAGETVAPGAAAGTVTGQNVGTATEARAGVNAAQPMPAELNQAAQATARTAESLQAAPTSPTKARKGFYLRPRADGVPDILDAIQELGGLQPPGESTGGEYDAFRESMTGPARLLINRQARHRPDTIIAELRDIGAPNAERIETADDLYDYIRAAVAGREKLRVAGFAQREEAKQSVEFDKRAIAGQRPKREQGTFSRVPVGALRAGDTFDVQGAQFTVQALEYAEDGTLAFVQVKDGPKFGVQNVDGDAFIHMDNRTYEPGPEHDVSLPAEIPDAVLAGQRFSLGGEFQFEAPESVAEQKAREAREAEGQRRKGEKEQAAERAARRLTGADLDTTRDIFSGIEGRETRTDKTGQGSLFALGEPRAKGGEERGLQETQEEVTAPEQVAAELGWTYQPSRQVGAIRLEGLSAKDRARLLALGEQWEFTDRRPDSPTRGLSFYVPAGSSRATILRRAQEKQAEVEELRFALGQLRETPQALEGRTGELDAIALDLYRRPYEELPPDEQGMVQVTLEHEDARKAQAEVPAGAPVETARRLETAPAGATAAGATRPVRPAGARAQAQTQRAELAQEIYGRNFDQLSDEAQAHVRDEHRRGRRPGESAGNVISQRLQELWDQRAREEERYYYAGKGPGEKLSARAANALASIRFIDGQLAILREIADAEAQVKRQWFRAFTEADTPQALEELQREFRFAMSERGRVGEGNVQPSKVEALADRARTEAIASRMQIQRIAAEVGLENFTIVYRPEWEHNERSVQAVMTRDGRVTINAGGENMTDAATVRQVLREERAHQLLSSPEGRAAIRKFALEQMTDAEEERLFSMGYTGDRELLADEFIAKQARENTPWWQELIERVRVWLAEKGVVNLTKDEVARSILRSLREVPAAGQVRTGRRFSVGGRWQAIESTYEQAERAMKALPGVPLQDIFYIRTYRKETGKIPAESATVQEDFVKRSELQQRLAELDRQFPPSEFGQSIDPGVTPYAPRKGEPSFKEWLLARGSRLNADELGQENLFALGETGIDLPAQIAEAEAELKAAIRQFMSPPEGMSKQQAREQRDAVARRLRDLQRQRLQEMLTVQVDELRGNPEELARHISETVDLLNSALDDISQLKANGQAVTSTLNKFRNDLQTRLMVLKGWTETEEAEKGQRGRGAEGKGPEPGSIQRMREQEFEGATNPERKSLADWWNGTMRPWLRRFASPVPEIPLTGPQAVAAAPFMRGFRLFRAETARVRREAAAKIGHVLEPLLKDRTDGTQRTRAQNVALKRYMQLSNQLGRARSQGREELAQRISADMTKLEDEALKNDPFNLFRLIVLYRDLWWRGTYLKTENGKPITLPNGLTNEEVASRLQRLTTALDAHPDKAAITETLKRHYALTDELQRSILAHGEIIPEALRNPLYFPHHILDYWTGRIDRVRPSTEEDFRRYLIAPVGSGKLLQTDYLKAMYVHVADVLAHNARVDLVQKYWQRYDASPRLKEEFGEDWDKPWNLPPGYKLFTPFKKLPLRMDYILTREVLADKLGVLFNDGDLRVRAGEAGQVLKVKPEDLHAALVAGEKIKWALPVEIADALEGIAKREKARANPGLGHEAGWPVRKIVNFWKKTKLFAPWNWLRYEYGNTLTDVVDKIFVADPGAAKFIPQAAREIISAERSGAKSPEFIAASREGVFETITGSELGEARKLTSLPEFNALATTGENTRENVAGFARLTARASMFREAVFRYAKFLADVERMKVGRLPVYAGAYHESIEALGEEPIGQRPLLEGDDLIHAKAAEISLKTFGDYNSLSVVSQWLRQYLIPFHSWTDVNFRYHANQLRNIADGLRGIRGGTQRDVALKYAAVRVISLLAGVAAVQALWNTVGGALMGLWDDDDDLESQLSAHDRRRAHLILGKDENGKVLVAYTPSAFGDVAEWIGGNNGKRLFLEYAKGDITLGQFISDYAKQLPADTFNKLVQSTGPIVKGPYELGSGKAVFPDVLDQRTIPKSERWYRFMGTMTDDRAVNWLRQVFDQDYYAPGANEQLQQIILQVRRRDPEQWSYYEAREKAADWKEKQTGKRFEAGSYDAPEAQALRNFRRAIYRADVAAAEQFYQRLLEYGYTSERFDASIRAQHPLSDLNKEQQREYQAGLDARSQRELALALQYYERIAAFDRRERGLFPRERAVKRGVSKAPNMELLRELIRR